MAKFYGKVGYEELVDQYNTGVYMPVITERFYYGDINKINRRLQDRSEVNSDIVLNNVFSIVADAYAYEHFFAIRYIEWMGSLWKVSNVEVERPRLILTVGGVYNRNEAATSQCS